LATVPKYGKIKWDNIGFNVIFQLPNTADNSTETFAMVSDLDGKQNQLTAGTNITIDVTDPLAPVISASGGGSGETTTTMGALINSATEATPNDTDFIATAESAGLLKKITWKNAKAFLKAYFDTLFSPIATVPIETGTSFPLDNTYCGKVIILTASCTVTIPNGLMAGFNASFVTLAGVTLTVALGGSVVLFNNVGTTMAEKLSFTLQARTTTNNYITAGAL